MLNKTRELCFKLNYASKLPLYAQMAYLLKKGIKNGVLENENLPSVKDLMESSGVTNDVVVRAYRVLEESGIIRYKSSAAFAQDKGV